MRFLHVTIAMACSDGTVISQVESNDNKKNPIYLFCSVFILLLFVHDTKVSSLNFSFASKSWRTLPKIVKLVDSFPT